MSEETVFAKLKNGGIFEEEAVVANKITIKVKAVKISGEERRKRREKILEALLKERNG